MGLTVVFRATSRACYRAARAGFTPDSVAGVVSMGGRAVLLVSVLVTHPADGKLMPIPSLPHNYSRPSWCTE